MDKNSINGSKQKHGKVILYSDGGARGNPGPAGAGGLVLSINAEVLAEISEYLGETTNNVAEYTALIMTLGQAIRFKPDEVEIRADSELMVKQLKGEYKVKNQGLRPLYDQVKELLTPYKKVTIKHIYRSDNKRADELANAAMDARESIRSGLKIEAEARESAITETELKQKPEQGALF
jgi:ribonuclease HI